MGVARPPQQPPQEPAQRVALIGAGWAGLAAAVRLCSQGHAVTVFEAAAQLGGRARSLPQDDLGAPPLDNGQHLLIGAYTDCLGLMRQVGLDPDALCLRLPLALRTPDGQGLAMPDLPPPWDALLGVARAGGWSWGDKFALLRWSSRWQRAGFRCEAQATVADLCQGLPARLQSEFIEPLCVSALNTPIQRASGAVFLRVLQDGLFSGRGGSNFLLPRTDLGSLFPEAAARWLQARGAQVLRRQRVRGLHRLDGGRWTLDAGTGPATAVTDFDTDFDTVILATPWWEARRLLAGCGGLGAAEQAGVQAWCARADALRPEAIATVYAQALGARLPRPILALRSGPGAPAQFVIDRGQLGGPAGQLALVVSASQGEREALQAQALAQARAQLGLPQLAALRTIVEKRATFACTPGLQRPGLAVAPGLWACGDYIDGPYPATLEGAVRSGIAAAKSCSQSSGG